MTRIIETHATFANFVHSSFLPRINSIARLHRNLVSTSRTTYVPSEDPPECIVCGDHVAPEQTICLCPQPRHVYCTTDCVVTFLGTMTHDAQQVCPLCFEPLLIPTDIYDQTLRKLRQDRDALEHMTGLLAERNNEAAQELQQRQDQVDAQHEIIVLQHQAKETMTEEHFWERAGVATLCLFFVYMTAMFIHFRKPKYRDEDFYIHQAKIEELATTMQQDPEWTSIVDKMKLALSRSIDDRVQSDDVVRFALLTLVFAHVVVIMLQFKPR